jgi:DNA-directed RNA polymerase subunit alpha
MKIMELGLSVRAYNCLQRAGVRTTEDLCNKTPEDIMSVRNLGRRCLEEILEVMKSHGLKFKEVEVAE